MTPSRLLGLGSGSLESLSGTLELFVISLGRMNTLTTHQLGLKRHQIPSLSPRKQISLNLVSSPRHPDYDAKLVEKI